MYHVTRLHTVMCIESGNKHVARSGARTPDYAYVASTKAQAALARSLRWIASLINRAPFAADTPPRVADWRGPAFRPLYPCNFSICHYCPRVRPCFTLEVHRDRRKSWKSRSNAAPPNLSNISQESSSIRCSGMHVKGMRDSRVILRSITRRLCVE